MPHWKGDIDLAQRSLEESFDLIPVDLTDCPVFLAVAVPRQERLTGRKPRLPSGRGLSRAMANASAVGETVELLASLAQNADVSAPDFENRDGIEYVAMRDMATSKTQFWPAQEVFLDWAAGNDEPLVTDADSNGCAAGVTVERAIAQALLEVIERDALATWWYGRQRRPHLPLGVIDDSEPRLSWWIAGRYRPTQLIDISRSRSAHAIAAVSSDPDGRNIAIGSAADMTLVAAALKAITEMIQTEVAMTAAAQYPDGEFTAWLAGASMSMPQFEPAERRDVLGLPRARALAEVMAEGHQVLMRDLTRRQDWLAAARVIVPGYSAMQGRGNAARILEFAEQHPEFGGARCAGDFETLEPY